MSRAMTLRLLAGLLISLASEKAGATNLLANGGFEDAVAIPTAVPSGYGYWSHDTASIVEASQGITPFQGSRMLRFIYSGMHGPSPTGSGSEVYQIIDVSDYLEVIRSGQAVAEANIMFNRVQLDAQTDTQFGMDIRAYAGLPSSFPSQISVSELAMSSGMILTDADLGTWEKVQMSLSIPASTDFLVVRIFASENIYNDGTGTEFDGHYADAANFVIVPEPASLSLLALGGLAMLRRRSISRKSRKGAEQ